MDVIISKPDSTPLPSSITHKEKEAIKMPASKSLSHRALIAASLASGTSEVYDLAKNDDIEATSKALRQLGAKIDESSDIVYVNGVENLSAYNSSIVDCKESASTLRFLIPLLAQSGKICTLTGAERLMQRPLTIYEKLYEITDITGGNSSSVIGKRIYGRLRPAVFSLPGNISSQFISGLLFILPLLDGDSVIDIHPPFESEPYVKLTLDVLMHFGINADIFSAKDFKLGNIKNNSPVGRTLIKVPGNQKYSYSKYTVEGDWSAAAFLIAQSMLSERKIVLSGLNPDSSQGDKEIINFAEQFGSKVEFSESQSSKEIITTILPGKLKAIEANISDCPDLGPVLFALASVCEGTSVITGISRLRIKESDRAAAMKEELGKLGCEIKTDENTAYISGLQNFQGGIRLNGHGDHRIVMALSLLANKTSQPILIQGAEAIKKSYPDFFKDLNKCDMLIRLIR